jgi:hypothetical protein
MSARPPARRTVLKALLAGAASAAWVGTASAAPTQTGHRARGSVLAPGNIGRLDPAAGGGGALTRIDLATGRWSRTPFAARSAHWALPLRDGGALVIPQRNAELVLLDADNRIAAERRYDGLLFNGHGLELADGRIAVSATRGGPTPRGDDEPPTAPPQGVLAVVDRAAMDLVDIVPLFAQHPHEMVEHAGRIWVCDYGHSRVYADGLLMDARRPGILELDAATLQPMAFHAVPGRAVVSHVAVGGDGALYAILNQARFFDGYDGLAEAAAADDVLLTVEEIRRNEYEVPLPVVRLDVRAGGPAAHLPRLPAALQRRAQSIAGDPATGLVFATHTQSDTLWRYDPRSDEVRTTPAGSIGLQGLRGVAVVGDAGLVAVSGEYSTVAILDALSLETLARVPAPLLFNVHLSWSGAA